MPQLLKDKRVIDDTWTVLDTDSQSLPEGDILLTYSQWQTFSEQLESHSGQIGVVIDGNAEIEDIIEPLLKLPLIAINFPKFADGRGFSLATLLRERYNFNGEIRAVGGFIRDQLYLLSRCGFNAFKFSEDTDLSEAAKSLEVFTETYQVSANQEEPLFRRR
ncbi:MAG: DUF934 domain-containing protein [Porticoccaceae bacterium]